MITYAIVPRCTIQINFFMRIFMDVKNGGIEKQIIRVCVERIEYDKNGGVNKITRFYSDGEEGIIFDSESDVVIE
jgi:hypothetical protein